MPVHEAARRVVSSVVSWLGTLLHLFPPLQTQQLLRHGVQPFLLSPLLVTLSPALQPMGCSRPPGSVPGISHHPRNHCLTGFLLIFTFILSTLCSETLTHGQLPAGSSPVLLALMSVALRLAQGHPHAILHTAFD